MEQSFVRRDDMLLDVSMHARSAYILPTSPYNSQRSSVVL